MVRRPPETPALTVACRLWREHFDPGWQVVGVIVTDGPRTIVLAASDGELAPTYDGERLADAIDAAEAIAVERGPIATIEAHREGAIAWRFVLAPRGARGVA